MAEIKFSYKEAIVHGWAMTKKHWQFIFVVSVIYLLVTAIGGVLGYFEGASNLPRFEVQKLYQDSAQGDRFYQYLQDDGYIDAKGHVQDKLQNMSTPDDLATLPPEFQDQRGDIYNFLNHYRYRLPFPQPVTVVLNVVLWVISILMAIGVTRIFLMLSRDIELPLSALF
ncbi:MAG: hypothetical protein Q7T18_06100, partial [Sedimentisphaerales bacterium]|nr:hypothetical protein [Sedimentisphaerales bacterium]